MRWLFPQKYEVLIFFLYQLQNSAHVLHVITLFPPFPFLNLFFEKQKQNRSASPKIVLKFRMRLLFTKKYLTVWFWIFVNIPDQSRRTPSWKQYVFVYLQM